MMSTPRKAFTLTGAAALAFLVGQPAIADDHSENAADTEMTKGEKKLADILEGRVAGEPTRCIRTRPNERLRVVDDTAYVYGSGRTIYVQRTKNPDKIDRDDILVSRRFNASQICKLDMVHTVDRGIGMFTGAVFFEDFVPYTKAEQVKEAS
ncbi:hypothetical protein [Erythrobacter crassostreae]|uniref:Secreted protein n=1 Tax=Erythrobacter crassostreae TaxID=2828328 RepID=A0A9X1F3I5_9SPHN|nr:hypothetical protein [Erythrobacter crassostrea]MBV7258838.1 hypothetical protein [Erythrobacter crassostrea]